MGSFWGMNDAGQEAGGFPREYGNWSFQQYRDALNQQNRYKDLGGFYNQGAGDYWTERRNEGFKSPDQIAATGRNISPWVQDYISNEEARRRAIREREAGRRTTGDVSQEMSGRLDEMGQNISSNYTGQEGEINDTATRGINREEAASTDVINNLKGSSASLRAAVNDTFTGLRGDNARTYEGIRRTGRETFDEQLANLDALKPGSLAQQARVGRSFAPQIADTLARIRRVGIDPNSPEAASLLRAVETSRSRAMDDASADGTRTYVEGKNRIASDRLGFDSGAAQDRLSGERVLATGQTDRSNDITGREADAFNTETLRRTGAVGNIDRDRSGRAYENTDTSFRRGNDLLGLRNDLTGWTRSADMQDVDRERDITEGDSTSEMGRGRAYDTQFDRGTAWQGMDQSTRDTAATNLGNLGGRYMDYGFRSGDQALRYGDAAGRAYDQTYAREAPKAGWGSRLLGGLASTGLQLLSGMAGGGGGESGGEGGGGGGWSRWITGLGSSALGSLTGNNSNSGGGGRQYGGSGTFGGGASPGNPYVFSALPPSSYRMPTQQQQPPQRRQQQDREWKAY